MLVMTPKPESDTNGKIQISYTVLLEKMATDCKTRGGACDGAKP
jgi:hypothetical protein